jgi:diguanylate cyclase (GGDEF)-like protein
VEANVLGRRAPDDGTINVLIIEDNSMDAELSLLELRRAGVLTNCVIVANQDELGVALRTFVPDVILCDFSLAGFDGFAAQRIVREVYADTPLIFVTGTLSEDRAVMALQSGAVDYILKSSLLRLPTAVQRAVHEAREHRRFEESLTVAQERARQHAERLDALWQIANNPALRGQELMHAMLREAATAIRRPQRFRGVLARIEGGEVVVVGVGVDPDDDSHAIFLQIGQRVLLENTLIPRIHRSQGLDDLAIMSDVPERVLCMGWRSVISTHFDAGDFRYALTFASPEPTTTAFGTEDFAYLEVLASSFANQLQVNRLEDSLRDEEERSRQHAERLEALWKIVNDPALRDAELWFAMLSQAASAIRPSQGYRGMLWRIQGAEMILEAAADAPGHLLSERQTEVGSAIPLERTVIGKILAKGGGTRSWDDTHANVFSSPLARSIGSRSFAVTTFAAGGTTWALAFASGRTPSKPLGPQDHAYIEVLASFFANHVQQRWQFDRIQYQQSHDVLTGLLNRSQFRSQARSATNTADRYAVIQVDVNTFREINEAYGHMIGDALLVEVGNALQQRVSGDEIVGRVGGDVFGIYIPNPSSREFVRGRALDFAEVFVRGFSTGDREGKEFIALTASLGVAVAPDDGATLDAILSHADAALFIAKERGHGSMVFYETGMEGDAQRRAAFRNELTEAIAGDQFTLYYQPHVELSTGAVTGCEALIRWNHPARGLLLPGHFIPFAEQTGIITSIDTWVMQNAFAAAAELAALRPGFRLYFNLSGRQAGNPKLIRAFTAAARDGVALGNIGVEITESDAMRDVEATRHVCRALRRLNVRIAIDDFGTGYSSLSSLKRLPVDIVKIDQSFIAGILSDPDDEAIAETIIAISKHFGFESLAEGAEQPAEVEWLRQRGCRYVQGFAISHALPLDDFKSWVSARDG